MKTPGDIDRDRRRVVRSLLQSAVVGRLAGAFAVAGASVAHGIEVQSRPWADPASLVSVIACGTVTVPDVDQTAAAYRLGLRYVTHWEGRVSEAMARCWGVPAMAGRKAALMGPEGLATGLIRIVELGTDFEHVPKNTTLGWTALEIRVRNVDALPEQLAGTPITHTGGPSDLKWSDAPATLRAAQFHGPSGEPLYFTQDLQFDRSTLIGNDNVGGIFLQTLTAMPYEDTRNFYLRTLAMQLRLEVGVPRTSAHAALGVEGKGLYRMASVRAPQYCAIQIDEYPDAVKPRPAEPGCFPPGVCMSTLGVRDIDRIAGALQGVGVPFRQLDSSPMPPFAGNRTLACRGYSGEFVEFVEIGKS